MMLLCAMPLLSVMLWEFSDKNKDVWIFSVHENFYTNIWTIFGIATALFAGILAYIDYTIRKELTITLFGATLFISAILDGYYLLILNENTTLAQHTDHLYFIWWVNRVFYSLTLLIGTAVYLKIKAKNLRTIEQKNRIIWRTAVISILAGVTCVIVMANTAIILPQKQVLKSFGDINFFSFFPLIFLFFWTVYFLPKFMSRFHSIFSKMLILSIVPLFLTQLFMALSVTAFDSYFNAAHYLRFVSYFVPLAGIILNYVATIRNEQRMIAKLDQEVKVSALLSVNLQEREALLANAEHIANLGSWELDVANNAYKWSDELYRIYGFEDSSFQPTYAIVEKIIAPEYVKKFAKELSHAVNNKTSFAAEYQIVQPNGVRRYVLGQGYFSVKENKLVGTVQDITELKEATLKLRRNETLMREGEAVSQNGSWEWRNDDEVIFWSEEMFNIHGFLPHATIITRQTYIDFIHPEDIDFVSNKFTQAKREHSSFKISYRIIRPNNEVRFVSTTAKYKADESGSGFAFLGNTQDVTVLREVERKLEEKINELNISNNDLEQFAYVASHDLQEPLRKIRAFGDRLKTKFSDTVSEEGQDYIARMQNAAERMQTLIDDLLTFSKATRETKEFQEVDLNVVFEKVIQDLDYRIETTGAVVNLAVTDHVDGTAPQLAQVFLNILSNSLKFIKPDITPVINISSEVILGKNLPITVALPNQQYCVIKISDNGIGFDEEYAGKIFDLFQRLHARADYKGTGIGLAICKKIIERHYGFIFANSIEGEGASFFIAIPVKKYLAV